MELTDTGKSWKWIKVCNLYYRKRAMRIIFNNSNFHYSFLCWPIRSTTRSRVIRLKWNTQLARSVLVLAFARFTEEMKIELGWNKTINCILWKARATQRNNNNNKIAISIWFILSLAFSHTIRLRDVNYAVYKRY